MWPGNNDAGGIRDIDGKPSGGASGDGGSAWPGITEKSNVEGPGEGGKGPTISGVHKGKTGPKGY